MSIPSESVASAEHLVKLVRSVAQDPGPEPLTLWKTKIEIQRQCDRLLAQVMGPLEFTILLAESCQESQALHFVSSLRIPDLIGDGQRSLNELSSLASVNPQFLGVAMNCLTGRGYFEEIGGFGSDVYSNNELSSILRDDHPTSIRDAVGFIGDEGFRATSRLLDAAQIDAKEPAVNIAFGFSGSIFDWMASPAEAWRGERMGKTMTQVHAMANKHVAEDYNWGDLVSPIVDVGGGIGTLELTLFGVKSYQHLEFLLFDIPKTIENATEVWKNQPAAVASRVSFVPGNFMVSSLEESNLPVQKPTYVIRHVLHDWDDDDAVKILVLVRKAMPRDGLLLLVDMVLQEDSSRFIRTTSMQLLALNNGITRTQVAMEDLLVKAGFRVKRVVHMRAADSVMEAVVA